MYILHYDIAAIILISVVIAFFYSRKQLPIEQNSMFIRLAWTIFLSVLFDLICGFLQSGSKTVSYNVLIVANLCYFIFRVLVVYDLVLYVISLTGRFKTIKKKYNLILMTPLLISLFSILISPFTGLVFYINEQKEYVRGSGMFITYVMAGIYLVFAAVYTAKHRDVILAKTQQSIYFFVILSLFPVVLQIYFPYILVEGFGISLCALLMYVGIQRPEEVQDKETQLLNNEAFMTVMPVSLTVNNKFYVLTIIVDEYATLTRTLGVITLKKIIIKIAMFLKKMAGKNRIYRIAPNEFCIVMDTEDVEKVQVLAETIIDRFHSPWSFDEGRMCINTRMCAVECPTQAQSIEELLGHIETASFHHNCERLLYVKDLEMSLMKRRNDIKEALERAIANSEFEVYYQPIYESVTGNIESAEALLRLNDSVLGFVSPEEFIPIAEKTGHILWIGRFVLESVCKFYKENNLAKRNIKYIDINLSVIECVQDNLVEQLNEIMGRYDILPENINLEITETAKSYSLEAFKNNVHLIADSGFGLSLDDYGTGYSTISYILELPFNTIKLDKSIVWAAFESAKARQVLKSSISMIKGLDMKIVAEGVETLEQYECLRKWGCEYLQGYYFSRPVKAETFSEMIEQNEE